MEISSTLYFLHVLTLFIMNQTCFWADPTEERILHRRQQDAWKDLHGFVEERFHHAPVMATGASEGILMARKRGDGKPNTGLPHHPTLVDKATEWTHTLDAWHLVAFSSMCAQAKSFLVAWAVLEPDSPFKEMTKAVEAARVEEEFQISSWGLVEGGHDYDRLNCSIQLRSGEVFTKTIKMDNKL
jgi:ATP synthase F1 complex assembly factor 2